MYLYFLCNSVPFFKNAEINGSENVAGNIAALTKF